MTTTLEPRVEGATQTWQLDAAHTNVEFAVKHLMIATVKGRFGDVAGTLTTNADDEKEFSLEAEIATESIDTRQGQRDAHLRSADFFDAERFPRMRFVGNRIEGNVADEFKVYGDLTIRDVTREIVLDVTNEGSVRDPWGNSKIGFSAKTRIDRKDFGLTWNQALEAGGLMVGDEVRISVDAEFTQVAPLS